MKGQKEGSKQNQVKGASGAAEREPLFPRLHVNETERAGPKAPPRNKMALYEQFTVPSHRFVQPSQTPTTTMYQQQYGTGEIGYPCVPYYMPSAQYANMNHGVPMYAQPSHNTSSSSVTVSSGVVNEDLLRNAPRHYKAGKLPPCRVSRHSTEATADCTVKSLPEEKGQVAIVPAQSSPTNHAEESTSSRQNAPSDMERSHITDLTESLQEALSSVEVGTECTKPDGKRCEDPRAHSIDCTRSRFVTDKAKLNQAAQLSIFETMTKPTKEGALDDLTVKSRLQIESTRDECKADCVTEALMSHVHHCTTESGTPLEPEERMTIDADSQSLLLSESQGIVVPQLVPTGDEMLEDSLQKSAMKSFTTNVGKEDNRAGDFFKPSFESSEELKTVESRTSEVLRPSQCRTQEGHSDGLIVPLTSLDSTRVIKPKDVIRAVGQQQFWKARKKLLRQQRIFSDQVFQLHKLIKIQQLLAETPGTLIVDDEMHFETIEEFDAITHLAKRATISNEDAKKSGSNLKEGNKGKSSETEGQSKHNWEQTPADGKGGLGSNKCMPELGSVGVSAWGYPSLGPWVNPMAAQGGPFNYQPFPGALPPGSAFCLPFGSPLPGSVGSMMPFGMPYCDRRQDVPAEVDSNYGPRTVFKPEGSGTLSVNSNHMSTDLAASWYFAHYNHFNNHRSLAGGSGKDAPTGSGASVNKSSASVQPVKASCFPGLAYQWGFNCQTGPLMTDGLENSTHQSDNSSPSDTAKLNCCTSSTPSTPPAKSLRLTHQDGEGLAQNLDPASALRCSTLDQYDSGKSLLGKEKLVTRILSHSKHQKDFSANCCPSSDGNECSSDLNQSALELFPLVPSLTSFSWSGGRVLKAAEEGQGGVIRAVPRRAIAASKSAAGILLSLQRERQK